MQCTDLSGQTTNCWDVIDSIQIHAYARTAQSVLGNIEGYHQTFLEDFEGTNGRKRKTLWLTEVAAASGDEAFVASFVDDLLNPSGGLTNRDKYGYVEKVSWFSEYSFPSFPVGASQTGGPDYIPAPYEPWVSSLFQPFGALTEIGSRFFGH